MINNIVALVCFAAVAGVLIWPSVRNSDHWRATVTPLASIIGSGFLVSFPLLAGAFGVWAPLAMGLLFGASYAMGGVIRFNIRHGEPLFEKKANWPARVERVSHAVLAIAYFVSVTYYLALLAAFVLKGVGQPGAEDGQMARWIATGLLALIGGVGALRGLRGLEHVEEVAVGIKLAVIAAIIGGLAVLNIEHLGEGTWALSHTDVRPGLDDFRVLLGMLIVVQGFETSRFLKNAYAADTRLRTMRTAQWLAGGIYVAFFGLGMVVMDRLPGTEDAAAVTDMVSPAASVLPVMLIAGAVFAQLSAAIADAIGGAGLIEETSGERITHKYAYPIIAVVGITIIWLTNIFEIITLASRAFAAYYAVQCGVAILSALKSDDVKSKAPVIAGAAAMGLLMLAVLVFGLPAEKVG